MSGLAKTSAEVVLTDGAKWDSGDTITLTVNSKEYKSTSNSTTFKDAVEELEELLGSSPFKATVSPVTSPSTGFKITLVDTSGQNMILSATATEVDGGSNDLDFKATAQPVTYTGGTKEGSKPLTTGSEVTVVGDIQWVGLDKNDTYTMKSTDNLLAPSNIAITGTKGDSVNNSLNSINISTYDGAQQAIKILDHAIADVDSNRGTLGAIQNRFQHTIYNLQNVRENMMGSRSRIKDTDYASEMSKLTRDQVLKQASMSGLNRANTMQQEVLALLQ
ncbi:flagellin [Endozoicomonas sp. GU-1]|nr:flagellin [Endozoicomonas sp. GU-1]WBA82482.1 flagellin [Endozoicomonas sp. GU-1]